MSEIRFQDRLFKGMILPVICVGVLLTFFLFVQPWISTDVLTRPISGPAGMIVGFALMHFSMMFMVYMMVALVYAVLLPVKYFRRSDRLVKSARRFVLFSDVLLVVMDLMLLYAYIETARCNYLDILNLPLVLPLTALSIIMTPFFICWTRAVYRHEGLKFFSWKTAGSVGLCLLLINLPYILLFVFLVIFG